MLSNIFQQPFRMLFQCWCDLNEVSLRSKKSGQYFHVWNNGRGLLIVIEKKKCCMEHSYFSHPVYLILKVFWSFFLHTFLLSSSFRYLSPKKDSFKNIRNTTCKFNTPFKDCRSSKKYKKTSWKYHQINF